MSTSSSFSAANILLLGILPMSLLPLCFGLGNSKPLYEASDPGLTLLNASDFKTIVHNSPNAWMVEFYSSWCGLCIRFAPTLKQIAKDAQKWSDVISVAAIDCAEEENMPICRDYGIMGYPSLKFFPPQAPISNQGFLRKGHSYEPKVIKGDMLAFVENMPNNHSNAGFSSVFYKIDASPMLTLYLVSGGLISLVCAWFLMQRRLVSCLRNLSGRNSSPSPWGRCVGVVRDHHIVGLHQEKMHFQKWWTDV